MPCHAVIECPRLSDVSTIGGLGLAHVHHLQDPEAGRRLASSPVVERCSPRNQAVAELGCAVKSSAGLDFGVVECHLRTLGWTVADVDRRIVRAADHQMLAESLDVA